MADSNISIETDYPVSITTTRPVSIKTEGARVTVTIDAADKPSGLVRTPEPPGPEAAVIPETRANLAPRCGKIMKRSQQPCARILGHNGVCANATQIARKQAYNARNARDRYQTDPDYAEKVKAASRAASHRKPEGAPGDD